MRVGTEETLSVLARVLRRRPMSAYGLSDRDGDVSSLVLTPQETGPGYVSGGKEIRRVPTDRNPTRT